MSQAFFDGARTAIDGRVERIQIQREDGSIRLDKEINQHNTIVDCGLDNILTVGGFPNGANTNNKTFDIFNSNIGTNYSYRYNGLMYDLAKWIRMLWFVQLGTDTEDTITTYDMTSLVQPYYNADGETYSQSHYIPTTGNARIRGTTQESYIEKNVSATHRITSNSIKISEDNTVITEIAFFVGINESWNSDWFTQKFNVGDMFCRIKLGENKVTLNKGERLVITYALTEYAGCTTHQVINDIHLTGSDGSPITFKDSAGVKHTIGAIARAWVCDGKGSGCGTGDNKLPGPFCNIAGTVDAGATYGYASFPDTTSYGNWFKCLYKPNAYAYASTYIHSSLLYFANEHYLTQTNCTYDNRGPYCYVHPFLVSLSEELYKNIDKTSNIDNYNTFDNYGFPNINTHHMYYGSQLGRYIGYSSDRSNILMPAGRCNNNTSNPTPWGNYTGSTQHEYLHQTPTIKAYTRGTFYRDHEYVIPTYMPRVASMTNTLPAPTGISRIYWLVINGMIYRIGYFKTPGNIDTFEPCYIEKKYGQVFRCTFRESVGRRNDINGSTGSKLMDNASKISSVTIRATTNVDGVMTTNYKPLQTVVDGINTAGDSFIFEIPYSNKTNDENVITSISIKSIASSDEDTVYEYSYDWTNFTYQDALAGWKVNVGTDADGVKHDFALINDSSTLYKNYIKFIDKNGNESEWLHVYDHTVIGGETDGN